MQVNGLLLIDKPKGWTSFDVVAKVRGVLRAEQKRLLAAGELLGTHGKPKVGHTGTLDPLATGLLVLVIGSYTKKVPELTKQNKSYEVEVYLGATSTTDDAEGEKTAVSTRQPSEQEVRDALTSFIGESQQLPPRFSAIKVGGVKAYDAARKGKALELKPRTVHIYDIANLTYAYPYVTFTAKVGSGTYIRSLARDVGDKLGTGAYVQELRRTEVGTYHIRDAISPEDITPDIIAKSVITVIS